MVVTFYIAWWFLNFFDGFFSPLYEATIGFHVFGKTRGLYKVNDRKGATWTSALILLRTCPDILVSSLGNLFWLRLL